MNAREFARFFVLMIGTGAVTAYWVDRLAIPDWVAGTLTCGGLLLGAAVACAVIWFWDGRHDHKGGLSS